MPISGVNILTYADSTSSIKARLADKAGVEVMGQSGNYLTLVLETESNSEMKELFDSLLEIPGVVMANLAYYNEEDV